MRPPLFVLCALALTALAIGQPGAAQQATSPVILLDHGVICDVTIEGRQDAPLTESGEINLIDQDRAIDVTTSAVPARKGLSFGIRIAVEEGAAIAEARVVVTHPPLGAAQITVQSWASPLNAGSNAINLFTFQHDYEMVQGRWSFQIVAAQGVLLEQVFDVLPPLAVPAVQKACFEEQILS